MKKMKTITIYQEIYHPRCQCGKTFKSVLEVTKKSHENFDAGVKSVLFKPTSMAYSSQVTLHQLSIHCNT